MSSLTESQAREILARDEGHTILQCSDCGYMWVQVKPMRRYGDHACPRCDSTFTGFVTEEVL